MELNFIGIEIYNQQNAVSDDHSPRWKTQGRQYELQFDHRAHCGVRRDRVQPRGLRPGRHEGQRQADCGGLKESAGIGDALGRCREGIAEWRERRANRAA